MIIDLAGALSDARRLWRRDRALLLRIAAPFIFLPAFTSLLLLPDPVLAPGAGAAERQAAFLAWCVANAPWLALRLGFDMFGVAAILVFYLDRGHATLGEALRRTLMLFPRYLLASVATMAIVLGGLFALIVPGLYAAGRLTMVGPALIGGGRGAADSITRSVTITQRLGWLLFGLVAATMLAGYFAASLLLAIDGAMSAAHATNPVTVAIIDAAAAGVSMLTTLARVLIEVAVYRWLAAKHGI